MTAPAPVLRTWLPQDSPKAVVLATSTSDTDAEALCRQGVEVHAFASAPSLQDLATAALTIRKRHPRLRLLVAAPDRVLRSFARRYPPLLDAGLLAVTPAAVLSALEPDGSQPS